MTRPAPRVSVVLCAAEATPTLSLSHAIESVLAQSGVHEIVVVVDRAPRLRDELRRRHDDVRVVENTRAPGLAGSRDTGIELSTGDVVTFLAADATAHAGWAEAMAAPFETVDVIAVVGRTEPTWSTSDGVRLPDDLFWVVGCTPRRRPDGVVGVGDLTGATVAFRRWDLLQVGGLASGVEAARRLPRGTELTELCLRLASDEPEARVVATSRARVSRQVPAAETGLRAVTRQAVAQGAAQSALRRTVGADPDADASRGVSFGRLASAALQGASIPWRGGASRSVVLAVAALGLLVGRVVGSARALRIDLGVDRVEPLRSASVRR